MRLPTSVLFICNFNRVRSPMAAAWMRRLYGNGVFVDSCGLKPLDGVDLMAATVMAEVGLDVSAHIGKTIDDLAPDSFELLVCLSPESHAAAQDLTRVCALTLELWPMSDPTATEGSREVMLDSYRQVRDTLRRRLTERFGPPTANS